MQDAFVLFIMLALWFVLQIWILPRMGVDT